MAIPARVHFCWLGSELPWTAVFAVLSAAENGEMDEIVLHHADALGDGDVVHALRAAPRVRLERMDPLSYLEICGTAVDAGGRLVDLYRELPYLAAKVDVLRVALLYLEGGLYFDIDTITVRSLRRLLELGAFVGTERIVWPGFVRAGYSPFLWTRSIVLDLLRKLFRSLPEGWRGFRRVERLYYRAEMNGLMGSEAGNPFFKEYLLAMSAVPEIRGRYDLGPDLLQDLLKRRPDLRVARVEPRVFSPLPPEISEHWFRRVGKPDLDAVLFPETCVVHWYASIHGKANAAPITPEYVREHRTHELYSALVWSFVSALREMEASRR